jgi:hypothetical protein
MADREIADRPMIDPSDQPIIDRDDPMKRSR